MHEPALSSKAEVPEIAAFLCQAVIRREDHTTFAGGNVFVGIKAEGRNVAERTDVALYPGLAAIALTDLFSAVFNDFEPMLSDQLHDRVHVDRQTVYVDDHDGFGPRCDLGFNLGRVDVP